MNMNNCYFLGYNMVVRLTLFRTHRRSFRFLVSVSTFGVYPAGSMQCMHLCIWFGTGFPCTHNRFHFLNIDIKMPSRLRGIVHVERSLAGYANSWGWLRAHCTNMSPGMKEAQAGERSSSRIIKDMPHTLTALHLRTVECSPQLDFICRL